jgi:hypothetical protein
MENQRREDGVCDASILGCLIPTFWMLVGNGILALCAVAIAAGTAVFGATDLLYWLTVVCLLGARYADIRYLGGKTADGEPATMAHWRRYAVILGAVSVAIWIVAHLVPDLGL